MKTIITLIVLFLSTCAFSQSGINYKAVIKDSGGNIVSNQTVDVQFIIYEGVALTKNVYQESHTTNTDGNGLLIVNIGEGTTANVFENIEWGIDEHFLNVQVNTGSGLVDMGTTAFKTVPYAINAEKANNVNGLEAVDEGNGIGHRVIGRNLNNLGNIGLNAVDLSVSPIASSTYGATGTYSVAMNRQTTAQGANATAMGLDSKAYGNTSTTMGFNSIANGYDSVAMGAYTVADAVQSVVMGRYNLGGGHNQIWNPLEPLFEIGNGSNNANRSNALTVLKNGTITAPSLTTALIDNADDKVLVTKEYGLANFGGSGLEAINEGNGTGHRIIGKDPNTAGNIGNNAVDLSQSPVSSSTYGATGSNSVALNRQTTAQGQNSTAMGLDTEANGNTSAAFGFNSVANGYDSVAMGAYTVADAVQSVVLGRYNVGGGHSQIWNPVEPLFEIGNGANNTNRSNALTVLKNGTITAPTLTNALIDNAGNKSLITKEYAETNYGPKTKVIMIPGLAFQPSNNTRPIFVAGPPGGIDKEAEGRYNMIYGMLFGRTTNNENRGEYLAPLILTEGSQVVEISAYMRYGLHITIEAFSPISNQNFVIKTLSSTDPIMDQVITINSFPFYIQPDFMYYIRVRPYESSIEWSGQGLKAIKFTYIE
tara:strand:+ start:52859 stop:54811 length:1953 start_codon:yes stop_codon:yes gene_type:complete